MSRIRDVFGRHSHTVLLSVVVGLITGIGLGYRILAPLFFE